MPNLDLRSLTKDIHEKAEKTKLSVMMVSGDVNLDLWASYLTQHYFIVSLLDSYVPDNVKYSNLILKDLISTNISKPVLLSTLDYAAHIVSVSEDLNKINSHVYVNYFKDVYGGKVVASKNPNLPKEHLIKLNIDTNYVRNQLVKLDDCCEINLAFEKVINIYNELES
jgi:hypothetical protein